MWMHVLCSSACAVSIDTSIFDIEHSKGERSSTFRFGLILVNFVMFCIILNHRLSTLCSTVKFECIFAGFSNGDSIWHIR